MRSVTLPAALAGSVPRREAEALVQQALDAAARASKGFSHHLCTQVRPKIGDLLAGPLQAAISIPQVRTARELCLTFSTPVNRDLLVGSDSTQAASVSAACLQGCRF